MEKPDPLSALSSTHRDRSLGLKQELSCLLEELSINAQSCKDWDRKPPKTPPDPT